MLPAFVIGLREGLETVVILGAIVLFLRIQHRGDLLRRVWWAAGLAAVICLFVALAIRFVEINLPWRQQEQLETVVGFVAVCMVTYMVVWMRRFPKDLEHDSQVAAAAALGRDSGRALVLFAFFAVLREGFEITVFVIATIGITGDNSWLATLGAILGILVALAVGIGIVRGSSHVDVARFFRATALVLVLSAAGIAMSTVHTGNAAGWITFGQTPQFDFSWIAPPGSVLSSITTGMFGLQPYPVVIEIIAWLGYLVPMTTVVLWPKRRPRPVETEARPTSRRRRSYWLVGATGAFSTVIAVVVVITSAPHGAKVTGSPTASRLRILYASLDDVSCVTPTRCIAVGEYLPVDKDAVTGDPDGDGHATRTLAEVFNGTRWSLAVSPNKGNGGDVLSSVSCPPAHECMAVGFYKAKKFPLSASVAPPSYPLIESYNGQDWRVLASPKTGANSVLSSVSCPTTSSCVAVGYTTAQTKEGGSIESSFVETFNGTSWKTSRFVGSPNSSSGLTAISCPGVSDCIAVGSIAPRSDPSATDPLIEAFHSGKWSSPSPPPPSAGPGILYDVDCVTVSRCIAVGSSQALRRNGSALVLSLEDGSWTADGAALHQQGDISLTAVSCGKSTVCTVAGTEWLSIDSAPERILVRVNGSDWHALSVATKADTIESISCAQPTDCLVVGSVSRNSFGNTAPMVAAFRNVSWTDETIPSP